MRAAVITLVLLASCAHVSKPRPVDPAELQRALACETHCEKWADTLVVHAFDESECCCWSIPPPGQVWPPSYFECFPWDRLTPSVLACR